ncbi:MULTISPECIES: antibiotic biosynthesis monooxygenase family protein [Tatumella]|uniref:Antibiotic biosynthesis monooxygenase n=2 Tax=Tatumella ptyseos TaxID=82987 RepID=A0A085JIQ4_9GAMM|nr:MULTISPECIES: antibiotic biosynthesis monooxygenase [Tatumella]KFD20350.1 antibiotic biosynthesis monooxygenase [Tatumella ptyseos ATCC 33301]SQK76084.1 Antibiotic biosynthesis monooxygenase [Tatumella ptyseos]
MIAVLFEADIQAQSQERYLELASALKPMLAEIPGFIAIERFRSLNDPEKILSLSWWEDEGAVLRWKSHALHLQAQEEGKRSVFSSYRIRVASVCRDYSSERRSLPHV